ncbi:MAG: DUF4388 domain-containing protein [Planctomycetes bacterium]|nr:DUF4388 domain-containing protein [Planctomycetota bacterium]
MPSTDPSKAGTESSVQELKASLCSMVDALVAKDEEEYESEFVHLLDRVRALVERKLCMEGAKSDTRDLLGELLFTRLRRGMHLFLKCEDEVVPTRAAEWVVGMMFSITTLSEFAKAFDKVLIGANTGGANKDFNFAGRTDFISVEEVMQMLSQGKHIGCLSLEKDDNRLDIYIKDGRIYFLDPHHIVRRVMPGDSMRHREISEAKVTEAEAIRTRTGRPALLTLLEKGVFQAAEMREVLRLHGREALFDFMRTAEPYAFYYRQLQALPEFALTHDVRLGVTSMLLEGSKQIDDWAQMRELFPDPDAPIEPKADMFARMGDIALDVLEIKLLSAINGDTSPRSLVPILGLPLFDIYAILIKLSRTGVLSVPGSESALGSMSLSVEASMQEAFAALDANDDQQQRQSAIDRVFGDGPNEPGAGGIHGLGLGGQTAASALDAVLGGGPRRERDPGDGGPSDLDQDLLSILRDRD